MEKQQYVPETMIAISESEEVRKLVGEILSNGGFECHIINPKRALLSHHSAALEKNKNPIILDMQLQEPMSKSLVRQILKETELSRVIVISHNAVQTESLNQKGFVHVVEYPMRGVILMSAIDDCVGDDD